MPIRSEGREQPQPRPWVVVAVLGALMVLVKVISAGASGLISIARNEAELRGFDTVAVLDSARWGRRKT